MPIHRDHYTNVLKYWRSIETFALPDIPSRKKDGKILARLEPGDPLPWEPDRLPPLTEGKQWRHTLYFHLVAKEDVVELLARLSGSGEFREYVGGVTCLSALVLDHLGQPSERTYSPAAFIYGIKILREKRDPEELAGLLKKAQEDFLLRWEIVKQQEAGPQTGIGVEESKAPDPKRTGWPVLSKELDVLRALARNEWKPQNSILCISEAVAPTATAEAPFLNSYYVKDLNTLIQCGGDIGRPLGIYLTEEADISARYDLFDQEVFLRSLHPRHQSPGQWPSDPAFGLYSAQQAAVQVAVSSLQQGSGLLGINGPPGTGKTTLLREVVAGVVVTRAKRLLRSDVSRLFAHKQIPIAELLSYYRIDPTVSGNDGIVVSSNNNAAIENISKELPLLKSIDRQVFKDAEYFSRFATNIQGEPCWGLLSAALGRSDKRNTFLTRFWFHREHGFGRHLKEQYDALQSKQNRECYEATATELRSLLAEYDQYQALACEYHDVLSGVLCEKEDRPQERERLRYLASRLDKEYGIFPANLPDLRFLELPPEHIHRMTPYSSEKINLLRSNIFLLSLELHEWAILLNAQYFNRNLNAFVNMLSNKHGDAIDEEVATNLWNSFFFCIPLVSVTLASFQRQFPKMGAGSIGWLLLDEAGQATPSSACGAIWRSQRCIVIGDTLQITPVVTLPKGLGEILQNAYGIRNDVWSPLYYSAQHLADRVTVLGTTIDLGGVQAWTGIPLRAHRRCSEPMFSLSNQIAYNGQMVKVMADKPVEIPTGNSGWIHIRGITALKDHAIAEELQVLGDLLQQLAHYEGRIFVISPFRSVADLCGENFYEKDRIECGTIHTFQGKEAEIVFLVLGTLPAGRAAREWAASSPNMLNVAITRGKERLYVIGDRKLWGAHPYFGYLAEKLPAKEHFSGRLF